jgi:glyoxylase-like metal-dependent hydrolase (beta-lactamase superfamily II)
VAANTYQVGRVKVHLISDGLFWTDGGANFGVVPKVLWERVIKADALNRVPMQLRCLLIETEAGLVLVDTGYGDKLAPRRREHLGLAGDLRLAGELASLGYTPADIAMVVNTHLHDDHAGGNTMVAPDGSIVPQFPNATYMVQRLELADATYPNERTRNTYFPENFLVLGSLCRNDQEAALQVLNGDSRITHEVRTLITPGHTRSHQAVIVESAGESAIFLGDAVPWAVSFEKLAWVAAFDAEPLVSMETKRNLREWALRKDALLFFQHDPHMGAGRLVRAGDEYRVVKES